MLAQEESIDRQDGFQTPAGFQLIVLPYADDLRDNATILDYAGFEIRDSNEAGICDTLSK